MKYQDRRMLFDVAERFGIELDRCPFCYSTAVALYMGPLPHVTCLHCGADGPIPQDTRAPLEDRQLRAVRLWNTRGPQ